MTDTHTTEIESLDEEDELNALYGKIADDLALLSEASEVPSGFRAPYDPFLAEDVDFKSNIWIRRVLQVQAWLNLEDEVPLSLLQSDPSQAARSIIAGLKEEPLTSDLSVCDGVIRLLLPAAEALSSRLDTATRMQDE